MPIVGTVGSLCARIRIPRRHTCACTTGKRNGHTYCTDRQNQEPSGSEAGERREAQGQSTSSHREGWLEKVRGHQMQRHQQAHRRSHGAGGVAGVAWRDRGGQLCVCTWTDRWEGDEGVCRVNGRQSGPVRS
eukprot:6207922-Pleurochrysis_carterae.AAC.3